MFEAFKTYSVDWLAGSDLVKKILCRHSTSLDSFQLCPGGNSFEMEGSIDATAPLNHAAFQILPSQNRYEVSVCSGNIIENLEAGLLEQLTLHLCEVKELCAKDSIDSFKFKLNLPENQNGAAWFTKSTLTRFLHIVASPDSLLKINAIEDEISQLEEARKFHLSLYTQGNEDKFGSREADHNLNNKFTSPEPQSEIASSDASRNELLQALDKRIMALKEGLFATFNQAAGATCSVKTISDLARFSEHFGAKDLRNYCCKLLEHGQSCLVLHPHDDDDSCIACDLRNESDGNTEGDNTVTSKSKVSVKPVKFVVSPAKVAQVERQSSSGSDVSSCLAEEGQAPIERRTVVRPATPRRSASPMRRVQIARMGSHKTTLLAIKSLNYFPTTERAVSQMPNDSEVEGSEQPKSEDNLQRMSVQDAINLFEGKRKDQNSDTQKLRMSADASITANKSVLRRWSAGMGDSSAKCISESPRNHVDENVVASSQEPGFISGNCDQVEASEADLKAEPSGSRSSSPLDPKSDSPPPSKQEDDLAKRRAASAEWNRLKEAEVKSMMKQIKETNPSQVTMVSESRGHKGRKDKKIHGVNTVKRPEKGAQIRVDQKNEPNPGKQHKLLKNSAPSSILPKGTSKLVTAKKAIPNGTSLPARRKSWPSAPLPTTPSRSPAGVSSAGSKTLEKLQQLQKPGKGSRSHPTRSLKGPDEKPRQTLKKVSKSTRAKVVNYPGDMIPADSSFSSKFTKKSSVVPLELKPYIRKGSGIGPGVGAGISPRGVSGKGGAVSQLKESLKKSLKSPVKVEEHENVLQPSDLASPEIVAAYLESSDVQAGKLESETEVTNSEIHGETIDNDQIGKVEGDLVTSPDTTQVEIEEPPTMPGICTDDSCQDDGKVEIEEPQILPGICTDDTCQDEVQVEIEEPPILPGICTDDTWQDEDQVEIEEPPILPGICTAGTCQDEYQVEMEEAPTVAALCNDGACQVEDDVVVISPGMWVETEEPATMPARHDVGPASLRVRQSLSQMLQEDNESEVIEWGNAENPPTLVYQKDAPKGLKRLLKFARKGRGDASPSAVSEEEDGEDSKANGRTHVEHLQRKSALHSKSYGQQAPSLSKSYDGQSGMDKSKEPATKAARSFFSLSAFKGSKPNFQKPH